MQQYYQPQGAQQDAPTLYKPLYFHMPRNFILLTMAIAVLLCSCGDDEKPVPAIQYPEDSQLHQYAYADDGVTDGEFTFTASAEWTATITETLTRQGLSWLKLSVGGAETYAGGAGRFTLRFELEPNYTGQNRLATVRISCAGDQVDIQVTQQATTAEGETPNPDTGEPDPGEPDPEPEKTPEEYYLETNAHFYTLLLTQEDWDALTDYEDIDKYHVVQYTGWSESSVSKHTHKEYHIHPVIDYEYTTMSFEKYATLPNNGNTMGSIFRLDTRYINHEIPTVTQFGNEAIEGYFRVLDGNLSLSSHIPTSSRDIATKFLYMGVDDKSITLHYLLPRVDASGTEDQKHPVHLYRIYKYKYDRVYILGSYNVEYK